MESSGKGEMPQLWLLDIGSAALLEKSALARRVTFLLKDSRNNLCEWKVMVLWADVEILGSIFYNLVGLGIG